MEEVQSLCTRIGIIDAGRVIACDSLDGLLHRLDGVIRFQVANMSPALRQRIASLPGVRLVERDGQPLELHGHDVNAGLLSLVALFNELDVKLTSLELEEPNLEQVFLHLTGRGLRD